MIARVRCGGRAAAALLGLALAACGAPAPRGGGRGGGGPAADSGAADPDCITDADFMSAEAAPLLGGDCAACHSEGGAAAGTRLRLGPPGAADREGDFAAVQAFLAAGPDAPDLLLQKPTNTVSHGGGQRFTLLDPRYAVLHELRARALDPGHCERPGDAPFTCTPGESHPGTTPLRRLTEAQLRHAIADLLGVALPEGLLPRTVVVSGFRSFPDNNTVSDAGAEQLLLAAEAAADAVDPAALLPCAVESADAPCVSAALATLGARAFRRPLTAAEEALVTRFAEAGLPPVDALRAGVYQLLLLPGFLYVDAPAGALLEPARGIAHLEDHAVATRLGLLFRDSLPDAPLREAAAAGRLHTRAQVEVEALRLVQAPAATRALLAFHEDWLHLSRLDGATRDPARYPGFSEEVFASARTETALFLTEVVWGGDARFSTLLQSRSSWQDATLAAVHGTADPGPGWHRLTLDAARPGVLTRTAFLAAHAYSGSSAPVRRGAWVLEELLCAELNPPPGVNMDIPAESEAAPTIRERLEQHWTDPACAACHTAIDPAGFAFEHYGALGEWRTHWENGVPIDATGSLDDPALSFDGAPALIAALEASPRARACYARRWFEYAVGRPAEPEDACTLDVLARRFDASGGNIRRLMVDVALTDAFLHRHAPAGTP